LDLIKQLGEQKGLLEKAIRDAAVSKFKINCILTSSDQNENEISSENGSQI